MIAIDRVEPKPNQRSPIGYIAPTRLPANLLKLPVPRVFKEHAEGPSLIFDATVSGSKQPC